MNLFLQDNCDADWFKLEKIHSHKVSTAVTRLDDKYLNRLL